MYKIICLFFVALSIRTHVSGKSSASCGSPAQSELVDKKFIPVPGCIAGESYQTTTLVGNCTCWRQAGQKCGYICDNEAIPTPDTAAQPVLSKGQISLRRKTGKSRVRRQTTCPPSPFPSTAVMFISDRNCTLLAMTRTQAVVIGRRNSACICSLPVRCGMLCYSLVDGSNPFG